MRITGLEPARHRHQNLNLARLPIPPYPRIAGTDFFGIYDYTVFPPVLSRFSRDFLLYKCLAK